MKTLYIPTTTLNFNNIMSSESISPKSFYVSRGFGYKTWYTIHENPFDNSILLYEEMPKVVRTTSDYDDYPMVIAISASDRLLDKLSSTSVDGVYQYSETIYLNAFDTEFFFDTEEHKLITLSKSESSAESKMVKLYQSRMNCAISYMRYNISSCKDLELNLDSIQKDQRINKLKGFLYGYYIGAALSMSPTTVETLNILNNIKNVVAAILSSINGGSKEQFYQLQEYFSLLSNLDPSRTELRMLIESSDMTTEEKIEKIYSNCGSYMYSISNGFRYVVKGIQNEKNGFGNNKAMLWINKQIEYIYNKSRSESSLLSTNSNEVVVSNLELSSINNNYIHGDIPKKLFLSIVNDVLATNKYNGKISTFQFEIATDITKKAKEIFGNNWENSKAKIYLNALRKHIKGEQFNYLWDSGVLSSVAAVILKGDDWEKLLDFLQTKQVFDYRIAFALYGELNGFANLTRDFTDIILKENHEYTFAILKSFARQIHGVELNLTDASILQSNQNQQNHKSDTTYLGYTLSLGIGPRFMQILKKYLDYRTRIFKELKKRLQEQEVDAKTLKEIVERVLAEYNTKHVYCEKAREALEQFNKEYTKENIIESNAIPPKFIFDKDAKSLIESVPNIPDQIRKLIILSLEDLQLAYEPGGYHYRQGESPENDNTIKHFLRWCTYKTNRTKIEKTEENKSILDRIRIILVQHYGLNQ